MLLISPLGPDTAKRFIADHHYAVVCPPSSRLFLGLFKPELVGVAVWGYGIRPLHTIKLLFPSLEVKDYFELCRFCVLDDEPKNTETQFLSKCIAYIKLHFAERKVLFSWADGLRGKPGYVYQAASWLYGGKIKSEFYITKSGEVVHPRLLITRYGRRDKEFTSKLGLRKVWGYQFRYCFFICSHKERKRLLKESAFSWSQNYPKMADLSWEIEAGQGSRESCQLPMLKGSGQFRSPAPLLELLRG